MRLSKFVFMALLACASTSVQAATIFNDNFDSYTGGLNWVPQGGWQVSDGTVDLIGQGIGFDFLPGNGKYIDLDGSTSNSGLFFHGLNLLAGTTYNLSFDLAGSQRGTTEQVQVSFGNVSQLYTLATNVGFTNYTLSFLANASGVYNVNFQNLSNDNIGILLDNVKVDSVPSAVPVPAALPLMLSGLGVLGFAARRRKEKV